MTGKLIFLKSIQIFPLFLKIKVLIIYSTASLNGISLFSSLFHPLVDFPHLILYRKGLSWQISIVVVGRTRN